MGILEGLKIAHTPHGVAHSDVGLLIRCKTFSLVLTYTAAYLAKGQHYISYALRTGTVVSGRFFPNLSPLKGSFYLHEITFLKTKTTTQIPSS